VHPPSLGKGIAEHKLAGWLPALTFWSYFLLQKSDEGSELRSRIFNRHVAQIDNFSKRTVPWVRVQVISANVRVDDLAAPRRRR
jgi:hypothetical protein